MINSKLRSLVLFFFLSFPCIHYAGDAEVLAWTEHTLISTLAVDYQTVHEGLKEARLHYSPEAWQALKYFFGDKITLITDEKLSLHPKSLGSGTIVNSGMMNKTTYWKIIQPIRIPELNKNINFSLVVIKNDKSSFLIQSVAVTQIWN